LKRFEEAGAAVAALQNSDGEARAGEGRRALPQLNLGDLFGGGEAEDGAFLSEEARAVPEGEAIGAGGGLQSNRKKPLLRGTSDGGDGGAVEGFETDFKRMADEGVGEFDLDLK